MRVDVVGDHLVAAGAETDSPLGRAYGCDCGSHEGNASTPLKDAHVARKGDTDDGDSDLPPIKPSGDDGQACGFHIFERVAAKSSLFTEASTDLSTAVIPGHVEVYRYVTFHSDHICPHVLGLNWSPDGLCLATASFDATTAIWQSNVSTWPCIV